MLESGESVEIDGSTVYDPAAETAKPAVVLRMPPHRADFLGKVLDAYTGVSRLVAQELPATEHGPAWALQRAAEAADPTLAHQMTSERRMAAASTLRQADHDDVTTIAIVEAVVRWLDEPGGDEYAYALLGATTDGPTQIKTFHELVEKRRRSPGDDA